MQLYEKLPAQIYQIEFNPMQGYSLSKYSDIEIKEKIYGIHQEKVDKVLKNYENFPRSLGVILSGDKGIGKSLFAKMLCQEAVEKGYPVLICHRYSGGIAQFLDSLDQELVVLFDEFDKTFKKSDDGCDAQSEMLTLFDGISQNKKLFCITCNSLYGLNDYLVNRPGRFHYHFRFDYPNKAAIEAYMKDHLPEDKWDQIQKIVAFSQKVETNYDCLRAIAYELRHCKTFEEAIADLNILRPDRGASTTMLLCFDDGTKMRGVCNVDVFSDIQECKWFGSKSEADEDYIIVKFVPTEAQWSEVDGSFYLPIDRLEVSDTVDQYDEDEYLLKKHKNYVMSHRAANVVGMFMRRNFNKQSIRFFENVEL